MLLEAQYKNSVTRDLRVFPECSWSVRSNGDVTQYWLFLACMTLEDGSHRLPLTSVTACHPKLRNAPEERKVQVPIYCKRTRDTVPSCKRISHFQRTWGAGPARTRQGRNLTWWKVSSGSRAGSGREDWATPSPPQPVTVALVWSTVARRRLRLWWSSLGEAGVVISEHLLSTRSWVVNITATASFNDAM